MNVILYFDNMSQKWAIDTAIPYYRRMVIDKDYISGGFNIFGDKLADIVRDVVATRVKYQLGIALVRFNDLDQAHEYIKQNNLTQILNIH